MEADRGRAGDHYLTEGAGVARRVTATDGRVTELAPLTGATYEGWVAGRDPETGEPRGRLCGDEHAVRFVEVVVNGPKTWSLAAALHPDMRTAYEAAPVDRHRPTRHRPVSPRRPGLDAQPVPQLGHRRAGVMQHDDPAATGVRVHVDHSRSTAQERDPRGGIADLGQLLQFDVQATDGAVCLDDVPTSPWHQAVSE